MSMLNYEEIAGLAKKCRMFSVIQFTDPKLLHKQKSA